MLNSASVGIPATRRLLAALAITLALLGSSVYLTSLTQAAAPTPEFYLETDDQRLIADIKNEFKEECEGAGGIYIDNDILDGTVVCLVNGGKFTCVIWQLMVSEYGGCYFEQIKPAVPDEPVRGSDPQKVAPAGPTSDPSIVRPVIEAQVAQPVETATTTDDKNNADAQVVQANAQPNPTPTSTSLVVD